MNSPRLSSLARGAGPAAAVLAVLATAGFGKALDGFAQGVHPVALLGAGGVPHALAFNVLGFMVPGVLAMLGALGVLRGLPAGSGWAARIGGQLLLLAGLAFLAMGLLPLDLDDLDGVTSQRHAAAWMIWALAFISGAALLGLGALKRATPLAGLALGCGAVAAIAAFGLQGVLPAAIAQRLAFLAWGLWLALSPWLLAPQGAQRSHR